MFFEEEIIGGVMHWRNSPDGAWTAYNAGQLTARLKKERDNNAVLRELVADAMEMENEFESDWDKAARAALAS